MPGPDSFLWAVHISDGVLTGPWLGAGFALTALFALISAWRITEEEIAQTALLTAAFFVASLYHVSLRVTSVHLLLNGLMGVVLGRRAALAIPVGLFLQVVLFQHGGYSTLGVNSCVMTIPALFAAGVFRLLHQMPWIRQPWFRGCLVAVCTAAWTLSLVYSVTLLCTNRVSQLDTLDTAAANELTVHPFTVGGALALSLLAAWLERRLENAPEFPLGLLVGELAVLFTLLLNCIVLLWGGQEDWHTLALLVFVAHLPVAVVEGIVLGFTVGFLARVKPELLGWSAEKTPCAADPLP